MNKTYEVIGSPAQFAIVDFHASINEATRMLKPAKFSNGCAALKWSWNFKTKREAANFVERCKNALAFQSGRIGRWMTPTFALVESKQLQMRA